MHYAPARVNVVLPNFKPHDFSTGGYFFLPHFISQYLKRLHISKKEKEMQGKELNYMHSESYDCYVNNSNIGIDLVVYECGYERCLPFHCWGPGERAYFVFHYVMSGKGTLISGEKTFNITAGQMFYTDPSVVTYYEADGDDPWEYKWVAFNGVRAINIVQRTLFENSNPVFDCPDGAGAVMHLDNIFESFNSKLTPNLLSVGHLYLFLSWLTQNFPQKSATTEESISEQRFFNILRHIQQCYTKRVKIGEIADTLNYDRSYIYKIFMKNLNMPPSEYIEGLRMKLACDLIRSKEFNLHEIASKVGYDNYNWFFTVFKRRFNVSPNEFMDLPEHERMKYDNEKLKLINDMLERYHTFIEKNFIL